MTSSDPTMTFPQQVCSAGSRLLIQETVKDKMLQKLRDRILSLRLGDSLDKSIDVGAVVDPSQRATVERYVEEARAEGAEVLVQKQHFLLFKENERESVDS